MLAVGALLAPLVGPATAGAAPAARAQCQPLTQVLHGHYYGSDGRHVNATIAFTVADRSMHEINAEGCGQSFDRPAFFVNPNYRLPADGSMTEGSTEWSVVLPANAWHVQIETYPRGPASSPRYQRTDLTYYARSMRRFNLPNTSDIQVVLPRADTCPAGTGVAERVVKAYRVAWNTKTHKSSITLDGAVTHADAFSGMPDKNNPNAGSPIQGLSLGSKPQPDGTVLLHEMASAPTRLGQPYTMVVSAPHFGGKAYSQDYRGRQTFGVTACSTGVAQVYELPTNLPFKERHRLQDALYKHHSNYLITVNT
ncbi:MAG TPA: hypothetical protein VHE83_14640 [Mycobacteriales bacterium]|nr:hypothetical protein [Mycobacteriales bacterium]